MTKLSKKKDQITSVEAHAMCVCAWSGCICSCPQDNIPVFQSIGGSVSWSTMSESVR